MEVKKLKEKIYEGLKKGVCVSSNKIATQYGVKEQIVVEIFEELHAERKVEIKPAPLGNAIDSNCSTLYMKW